MRILLDSNAYSAFMRGSHEVRELIQAAEEVLFSAVVVGEQLYGFRQGAHFEQNLAELRSFLERPYVSFVPVGPVTADRYSRVMTALRAKGRPIPTNDVWIAAHAMETGADLVSDDSHFEHVDGLRGSVCRQVEREAYASEETITLTRREYDALIERNSQLEDMLAGQDADDGVRIPL